MPGPGGSGLAPTFTACPQCGFFHPPLKQGEKCSLAKDKIGEKEIDLNAFFMKLRPILIASIQKKKIEKLDKLYTAIILSLQKILDDYKE
jgi:hypothetical protein